MLQCVPAPLSQYPSPGQHGCQRTLSSLDGTNGFTLNGIDANDGSGISASGAGDINGDGFDDLIIGAHGADPNGASAAGETYVIFGEAFPSGPSQAAPDTTLSPDLAADLVTEIDSSAANIDGWLI